MITLWDRPRSPEQLRCLPDERIRREVTHGNQEAFLVLFDRYWRQVFRLAYGVMRDEAEAEDLAQALFLQVHASMLRFDEQKGSFRTLLLRYAYTRAIDQRRRLESRRFYRKYMRRSSKISFPIFARRSYVCSEKCPAAGPRKGTRPTALHVLNRKPFGPYRSLLHEEPGHYVSVAKD